MFSLRVHYVETPGRHTMYECRNYSTGPTDGGGMTVTMTTSVGETESILLRPGSVCYVMGDSGKTVDVLRPRTTQAELRGAR